MASTSPKVNLVIALALVLSLLGGIYIYGFATSLFKKPCIAGEKIPGSVSLVLNEANENTYDEISNIARELGAELISKNEIIKAYPVYQLRVQVGQESRLIDAIKARLGSRIYMIYQDEKVCSKIQPA